MKTNWPLTRDLVLIGGGHAHALVLRSWGMSPMPGARLTLINPGPTAPYTGMLPGYVAGHYSRDELDIDLVRLARFAGARLILGAVTGIDRASKALSITDHPDIAYDIASIDIGITSQMPAIPGFSEHAIAAKPLGALSQAWAKYLANPPEVPRIAIIGGGVAGVELSLAMAHALHAQNTEPEISLIERGTLLSQSAEPTRRRLLESLRDHHVTVFENTNVLEITADHVHVERDGTQQDIPTNFVTGAAGAFPYKWLADTGLELHDGFITVDDTLRSVNDPNIYAVGDCAHIAHAPRPKAGVYAVRAAPILRQNLIADLSGGTRRAFHPQKDFLKLISLGGKSALAEKFGRAFAGPLLWRWKNQIDVKFMDKFRTYPPMPVPALPKLHAVDMDKAAETSLNLCGGCGAKVGPDALKASLKALPQANRSDVVLGMGDDAALLQMGQARQVLSHDHLRAFVSDPYLMAKITAIHALGDIWSMGAQPQGALTAITLPQMTPALQHRWMQEIMAGASEVFEASGAAILGGHSSTGSELTIGFTVTGLCTQDPITLSGAKPGDKLILTKPIGTGVMLAGEMALAARGDDYAQALVQMTCPQGLEAEAFKNAHAMTDVTGFGLAGHLLEICEASHVAARIDLARVPLLPGVEDLARSGIRSTLFAQNRARFADAPHAPRVDLMFDPQTAGGLLAAVAPSDAAKASDYGTIIGEITEGPAQVIFA